MELIKEAVQKAKAAAPSVADRSDSFSRPQIPAQAATKADPLHSKPGLPFATISLTAGGKWALPIVAPDPAHLERNRIVALSPNDPSRVPFNLLRTKLFKTLTDNHWKTVAVTSPTAGCGKTMVAVNLAFSLARQPNCRTVLIDLDLRKPEVARTVGLETKGSIGRYLQGRSSFEDCFVRVAENLVLGLNLQSVRNSAELMHHPQLKALLRRIVETLAPDVLLFDLPPVLATDDAIVFAPNVESYLLVAAAAKTTASQIKECERHFTGHQGYLGVVLNKSREPVHTYY